MIFLIINHILLLDINGFSTEVWAILDKLVEDPYNFQNNGYKSSYPIAQLIFQFGNKNIFSFNIKKLKVCFKCQFKEELNLFYGAYNSIGYT